MQKSPKLSWALMASSCLFIPFTALAEETALEEIALSNDFKLFMMYELFNMAQDSGVDFFLSPLVNIVAEGVTSLVDKF